MFTRQIRQAARQLLQRPGFTLAAVLTFALGIGVTTAVFSMVNSVLLASLPYPEPERIVRVFETLPDGFHNSVSGGVYKDWVEGNSSFEELAIYSVENMNLTGQGEPERVAGVRATASLLDVLGVSPVLGRNFTRREDHAGGDNHVALLTDRFWRQRYNASPAIIGETLMLDGQAFSVIGVLPSRALLENDALFVIPEVIDGEPASWQRWGHWRQVLGRLKPGADAAAAQADLRAVKQRLSEQYPSYKQEWSVAVLPVREVYAAEIRPTLLLLFATAALVLLIACSNVGNLLFARGAERAQELSVRSALGASRRQLMLQLLLESLVLAFGGGLAGLLLATLGLRTLSVMVTGMLPYALQPGLDWSMFVFSLSIAVACGLLFGLLPALKASRSDPAGALKEGERGTQSREKKRTQFAMLAFQFAFTLMLLIGAGLLLKSFITLRNIDPGFRQDHLLAFDVSLSDQRYPDTASRMDFARTVTERLRGMAGVESVASSTALPMSGRDSTEMLSRADQPFSPDYLVGFEPVAGDYFTTLGIPLLKGRLLDERDNRDDAPHVLVVSESVAQDLFPGENALGRRVRLFKDEWEIVGVVGNVRHEAMHEVTHPRVYAPWVRRPFAASFVVRSSAAPLGLVNSARNAVQSVDPDMPLANVRRVEDDVNASFARQRTTLTLLGLFAASAVLLSAIGIYGVIAYAVNRRRREFGIRAALGADRSRILQIVLVDGLRPTLLGVALGLFAAFGLARFAESLLYGVSSVDVPVYAVATFLLMLTAVFAVLGPAFRASRIAPMTALRQD